ncbi:hypothetical protein D3C85_1321500 [compost metagenome]
MALEEPPVGVVVVPTVSSAVPDFLQALITAGVETAPINKLLKKFFLSISNKVGETLIKYVEPKGL